MDELANKITLLRTELKKEIETIRKKIEQLNNS
jgi:hypothetical protein